MAKRYIKRPEAPGPVPGHWPAARILEAGADRLNRLFGTDRPQLGVHARRRRRNGTTTCLDCGATRDGDQWTGGDPTRCIPHAQNVPELRRTERRPADRMRDDAGPRRTDPDRPRNSGWSDPQYDGLGSAALPH